MRRRRASREELWTFSAYVYAELTIYPGLAWLVLVQTVVTKAPIPAWQTGRLAGKEPEDVGFMQGDKGKRAVATPARSGDEIMESAGGIGGVRYHGSLFPVSDGPL